MKWHSGNALDTASQLMCDQPSASGLAAQVRIVLYLGALCSGVLEMLAETEKAAIAAVASPERRRQPLLLLVSRARRSVEEKLEDRELKAAMSHKKAIDSSLHRILTSVSVHAGAGASPQNHLLPLPLRLQPLPAVSM